MYFSAKNIPQPRMVQPATGPMIPIRFTGGLQGLFGPGPRQILYRQSRVNRPALVKYPGRRGLRWLGDDGSDDSGSFDSVGLAPFDSSGIDIGGGTGSGVDLSNIPGLTPPGQGDNGIPVEDTSPTTIDQVPSGLPAGSTVDNAGNVMLPDGSIIFSDGNFMTANGDLFDSNGNLIAEAPTAPGADTSSASQASSGSSKSSGGGGSSGGSSGGSKSGGSSGSQQTSLQQILAALCQANPALCSNSSSLTPAQQAALNTLNAQNSFSSALPLVIGLGVLALFLI